MFSRLLSSFLMMLVIAVIASPAYAVTNKISANFAAGSVIIGPNSNTCNSGLAGALRFTSGSPGILAFCDSTTSAWVTLGGGGLTPAGANTQVQFKSGTTTLGASSNFVYDRTNNILSIANTGTGAVQSGFGSALLPRHSFAAGTSTGMYMPLLSNSLGFTVGGIPALQLDYTASAVNYLRMTAGVTGVAPTLTAVGAATSGTDLGLTFKGRDGPGNDLDAGGVIVKAGNGNGTGAGGAVNITSGTPGATGAGGAITVTAGDAGGINYGSAGYVNLVAGSSTGTAGSILYKLGATTYLTLQPPGTANASVVFAGTTSITAPIGSTGARPSVPVNGMLRYNTTTSKFEGVQAGSWTNLSASAATSLDALTDAATNYTGTASASSNSTYSMFIGQGVGATAQAGAAYNTAMGANAMQNLTTGTDNSAFGYMALNALTSGSYNTAGGSMALASNTTGSYNTAFGYRALVSNTTGSRNTAAGSGALASNTTGTDNTAAGYNALNSNTTGNYNTALGAYALGSNVTGSYNTAAGYMTLASATGSYNTGFGYKALQGVGGSYNTAIGSLALSSVSFTGSYNTAVGHGAGQSVTTGNYNVLIGYLAGSNITTGSSNLIIGTNTLLASSATVSNELNIGGVFQGVMGGSNYIRFDSKGHMNYKGSAPTLGTCGTSSVVGNDNEFIVTRGGTASTSCIVNFANSWTNAPICVVSASFVQTSPALYISAASTSSITITHTSNTGGKLYVMCRGYL